MWNGDRQALRDAVVRFNAEGLGGLVDRPRPGREPRQSEGEQAGLAGLILHGPRPERSGLSSRTLADLCQQGEATWGRRLQPASLSRVVRRLGTLPAESATGPPEIRRPGPGSVRKKGLQRALDDAAAAHPGTRITLWFEDEARVGQKGRTCHRRRLKGRRPPGLCDRRFTWTDIFTAIQPATGESTALVLPEVSTGAMSLLLERFSAERGADEHAVMVLDQAGWHGARALRIPGHVTPVALPPYAPELNPAERVWLHLRERHLSHRLPDVHDAIVDAWNRLTPERLRPLCSYPTIQQVNC